MAKPDDDKQRPAGTRAPDTLGDSETERRARRKGRDGDGRPLHAEETAPGERGNAPYGDSEAGRRAERPGT
jgi:hypothetical protein